MHALGGQFASYFSDAALAASAAAAAGSAPPLLFPHPFVDPLAHCNWTDLPLRQRVVMLYALAEARATTPGDDIADAVRAIVTSAGETNAPSSSSSAAGGAGAAPPAPAGPPSFSTVAAGASPLVVLEPEDTPTGTGDDDCPGAGLLRLRFIGTATLARGGLRYCECWCLKGLSVHVL